MFLWWIYFTKSQLRSLPALCFALLAMPIFMIYYGFECHIPLLICGDKILFLYNSALPVDLFFSLPWVKAIKHYALWPGLTCPLCSWTNNKLCIYKLRESKCRVRGKVKDKIMTETRPFSGKKIAALACIYGEEGILLLSAVTCSESILIPQIIESDDG